MVICVGIKGIMQLINFILINESFFKIQYEMLKKKITDVTDKSQKFLISDSSHNNLTPSSTSINLHNL